MGRARERMDPKSNTFRLKQTCTETLGDSFFFFFLFVKWVMVNHFFYDLTSLVFSMISFFLSKRRWPAGRNGCFAGCLSVRFHHSMVGWRTVAARSVHSGILWRACTRPRHHIITGVKMMCARNPVYSFSLRTLPEPIVKAPLISPLSLLCLFSLLSWDVYYPQGTVLFLEENTICSSQ